MRDALYPCIDGLPAREHFHYEFYFLPGATDEECAAHYRQELAYRGTVWHQINKVNEALRARGEQAVSEILDMTIAEDDYLPPGGGPQEGARAQKGLTGLWWPNSDMGLRKHFLHARSWFLVYPEAEMRGRAPGPRVRRVTFDFVSREPSFWRPGLGFGSGVRSNDAKPKPASEKPHVSELQLDSGSETASEPDSELIGDPVAMKSKVIGFAWSNLEGGIAEWLSRVSESDCCYLSFEAHSMADEELG